MKERYIELHDSFAKFRRLNLSSLYPQMSNGEMLTLKVISDWENGCGNFCGESKPEEQKGVNISQIVNKMCIAPPAVSRTLNSLEEKGLIERKVNKSDRRNTLVELTELGRKTQREADQAVGDYMTRIMERVGEEEILRMIESVNRVYDIAKEELEILMKENK